MHIPDGYLSPSTCAVARRRDGPGLGDGGRRRARKVVKSRYVPLRRRRRRVLSFLVMMFNVPIPDGTTAHAVGRC